MSDLAQYHVTCFDAKRNPLATFHVVEGTVLRAAQQACRQWVAEGIHGPLEGCQLLVQPLDLSPKIGSTPRRVPGSTRFDALRIIESLGLENEITKPRDAIWHAVYGACIARQLFDQGSRAHSGYDFENKDYEGWSEEAEHIADEDFAARKRRTGT